MTLTKYPPINRRAAVEYAFGALPCLRQRNLLLQSLSTAV